MRKNTDYSTLPSFRAHQHAVPGLSLWNACKTGSPYH